MEMIFGLRKFDKGEVLLYGKPVKIKAAKSAISSNMGFATEDRKGTGLVSERSISENADYVYRIKNKGNFGFIMPKTINKRVEEQIKNLRVICTGPAQPVRNLSGGNQQKVVLSKWLNTQPKVLILNEPTRGIDVGAKSEIYSVMEDLCAQGLGVVMISSELPEVLQLADRVIVMCEGRVTAEFTRAEMSQEKLMHGAIGEVQ
jgi:ribose transport system ATP-binding protein